MSAATVDVKGQTAFITGASSGIGKAIALALAKEGCNICGVGTKQENLNKVMDECKKLNPDIRALPLAIDISQKEALKNGIEECVNQLGGLNILINNAGIGGKSEDSLEDWEKTIEIDLLSVMRSVKFALPHMEKSSRGAIINISSECGRTQMKNTAPYTAAKHGVVGFSGTLFEDVRDKGIKVCNIEPGYVNTRLVQQTDTNKDMMIQPEDVAHIALFVIKFPDTSCPTEVYIRPQRNPTKSSQTK